MEPVQQPNAELTSEKPTTSEDSTGQAEASEKPFSLRDLPRLTWKRADGVECNVWQAAASDFHAVIAQCGTVENVDENVWPVFDRLDCVNELHLFCQRNAQSFPFTYVSDEAAQEAALSKKASKKA